MSEENIKLLKKAGLKITEPRLTILALMQEHKNEHFSAEEVYKNLVRTRQLILALQLYIACLTNLMKRIS